jgi:hypothetical protein
MDFPDHETIKLPPEPTPRPPRFRWLPTRRAILPLATFLAGMLTTLIILLVVVSLIGGNRPPVSNPSSSKGDIVIQVGPAYITHLVARNLQTAGLPGTVKNVQVTLAAGDQATVQGDDEFSTFGLTFTRHFTINVQPYVSKCQLQVRVIHADLSGIPVTSFAASFEGQINNQLHVNTTEFPQGFTYCDIGVRTAPSGLFITYSAKPIADTFKG